MEALAPSPPPTLRARTFNRLRGNRRWFEQGPGEGGLRWLLTLERGLLLFAACVFASGLVAAVAATFHLFRSAAALLISLWGLAGFALVALAVRRRIRIRGDAFDLAALLVAALAALSAGLGAHEYTQGQMDIGFYINDAHIMASTGGRTIHGAYDGLLPGFGPAPDGGYQIAAMFGYSALAALFGFAAGYYAIPWVNAPLALISTLAIYRIARGLGARWGALLAAFLYASALLTIWFGRWVMTENAATAVFWTAALLTLSLWDRWDGARAGALAATLTYGALVRAEGALVAAWLVLFLAFRHRSSWAAAIRGRLTAARASRRARGEALAGLVAVAALGVGVARVFGSLPSAYLRSNFTLALRVLGGQPVSDASDVPTSGAHPNWGDYALRYEWDSLAQYFVPLFLGVAILGLVLGLFPRKRALLLILLSAPFFVFVMMPPVTTFHPWFMRRLWIALIPLVYLLAAVGSDPVRVGLRWPIVLARSSRRYARVSAVAAATLVAGILVAGQVGLSAPILFASESDGSRALVPALEREIPPDAVVIVDQDVVGFGPPLRLVYGHNVIPWFLQPTNAFRQAFEADETHAHTYLVRFNTTLPLSVLRTDAGGAKRVLDYPLEIRFAPRINLRAYLADPPLEQGYAPLQEYLDSSVPPKSMIRAKVHVNLIETNKPLVLVKGVQFDAEAWERTPDGMRALRTYSPLHIDRQALDSESFASKLLGLYVVYDQVDRVGRVPLGWNETGGYMLGRTMESDGSGQLKFLEFPLPVPMDYVEFLFPPGTVLRGAYLGQWGI